MAVIKCKMCGGDIVLNEEKTFGTCEYCGSTMTLPKVGDDQRAALFNRGNHFRRMGEFDKALAIYENIVREDDADAEAHWCCALCRFGIEYVEDPNTFEFVPTCHRASFDSFLEDPDFKAALENSDGITRRQYQKDGAKIADVQKRILATSQTEEPFDVFICYKETDDTTKERTKDSLDAQEIYYQLTNEGYRVFFSRITLEDKAGAEYEPYIFAALNSAKVMVALGSKPEYFNAVWVKNEWSRFLALMRKDRSKLLLPCYKGMDPYDLPEQLSVLQSYDMSKIGFMQDLIRGIKKVLAKDEPAKAQPVQQPVVQQVVQGGGSTAPLLKRAFMYLEDGAWQNADEYAEKVLDQDPENAEAYVAKLMAELKVRTRDALKNQPQPFDGSNNYKKALRFGDDKLKTELNGCITHINDRNENQRITGIYNRATAVMTSANSESKFKEAAAVFRTIHGFKDADALAEKCLERAQACHKDSVYNTAKSQMTEDEVDGYESAIKLFGTIPGWKDADEQIKVCRTKIEEIKAKEEADRLERERQAEEKRIAAEKAAKKRKKIAAIVIPLIAACIALVILLTTVIIPNAKYNAAVKLYDAGKYEDAIAAFEALDGYKDSADKLNECKYCMAADLYSAGNYEEAIAVFTALNGYKESADKIQECKYAAAAELYSAGKYEEAIAAFKALNGFKDSAEQIEKCETAIKDEKYAAAVELYNAEKYEEAITVFKALDGYKDSAAKINEIKLKPKYYQQLFSDANVGSTVFFGSYEQDNITLNGQEEIEWIVLAKEGKKVLVISKYALNGQKYNSTSTDVTWETCSLRKWLNGAFLNAAFSSAEQNCIASSTVTADKNPSYSTSPGKNTTDKLFLLSITEAKKYFSLDNARQCQGTKYCSQYAARDLNGNCWWWLRSPGNSSDCAAGVNQDGSIDYLGYIGSSVGNTVRPAMWIDLGN